MGTNTRILKVRRPVTQFPGVSRPAPVYSIAPNKPNSARFWLKNAGHPKKQTQFPKQTQSPNSAYNPPAASRTTPVASSACEESK
jgi:hypothetical protein